MAFVKKKDTAPASAVVDVNTKLSEQPRYKDAHARLNTLQVARQKVAARARELTLILGTHVSIDEHAERNIDAALAFAETGIVQRPLHDVGDVRDELLVLRQQGEYLDREIRKLSGELRDIERDLAAQYFRANRSQHDDILRRYTQALRALDAIVAEEDAFVGQMNKLGYDVALQERAEWPLIGTLKDPHSAIAMRLRDLSNFDQA